MSTLEISDLHVEVAAEGGAKEILTGVDLTVRGGETHAIMGPNGSGKSTLAYAIAGHPKYTITGGTVTLDGEDVLAMTVDERARADSVPNLEIETGEIVSAGHASATGRFDDEQLFYLQSRGIPEDVARRLVVRGFFGEILARLPLPELRERLEAAIEAELAVTGV